MTSKRLKSFPWREILIVSFEWSHIKIFTFRWSKLYWNHFYKEGLDASNRQRMAPKNKLSKKKSEKKRILRTIFLFQHYTISDELNLTPKVAIHNSMWLLPLNNTLNQFTQYISSHHTHTVLCPEYLSNKLLLHFVASFVQWENVHFCFCYLINKVNTFEYSTHLEIETKMKLPIMNGWFGLVCIVLSLCAGN